MVPGSSQAAFSSSNQQNWVQNQHHKALDLAFPKQSHVSRNPLAEAQRYFTEEC